MRVAGFTSYSHIFDNLKPILPKNHHQTILI